MSYTRLRYHIISGTAGGEDLITPEVKPVLYGTLQNKAQEQGGKLLKIGGIPNHVHCLAIIPPTVPVATFVQTIKNSSSGAVNKAHIVDFAFSWQKGYGALTVNPFDMERLIAYIGHQPHHHATNTLIAAYERMG